MKTKWGTKKFPKGNEPSHSIFWKPKIIENKIFTKKNFLNERGCPKIQNSVGKSFVKKIIVVVHFTHL